MRTPASGLDLLRLGYALPLGSDGLRANLTASELRYKLGGDFAALQARGTATTWGVALAYPLQRAEIVNLNLAVALEARRFADDSLGAALRRKHVDALTLSANGDRIDGLGGGGIAQYGVSLVSGKLDLAGVAADLTADQAGPRANGGYAKLTANASRLQRLPAGFTFTLQLTVAAPLGNNPGQTATGRNQDGSARGTRGWLRLTKLF